MPVELGKISLAWHGWGPRIDFQDVRILDAKTHRVVLSAQGIGLDFSLFALLHGTGARPTGIRIDAPHVAAEETPDGRIIIPGLAASSSPAGNIAGMLGAHLEITKGTFALTLAGSDRVVWVFAPVNLDIGGGRSHSVELVLGLPKALGADTLKLDGEVDTPDVSLASWRWNGSYSIDRLLLAPLDRFVPEDYPAVSGNLASTGNFAGSGLNFKKIEGQLVASDLAAGTTRLTRLQTRYKFIGGNGYTLTLSDDRLVGPNMTWAPGDMSISRDTTGRIHTSIDNVALTALPSLTGFLPAKLEQYGERLHKMRPSGKIEGVKFAITPGKMDMDLQARLSDVGVYAAEGAPGFNKLSGTVAIDRGTGVFKLDAPGFILRMPHIFGHPVPLDRVAGDIGIGLTGGGLSIATDKLALSGPVGLDGALEGKIDIPRSGPITIDLSASGGPIAVVPARKLYLPTGLMPKPLDDWLLHSLDGGRITGATLTLTGQAARFPFTKGGGRFAVDFGFEGVTLKPGEHWEPLRNMNGSVHFLNAGMTSDITGGQIGHAGRVVKAVVMLPDMFKPRLKVQGQVAGDASDFLAFLLASPIGGDLKGLDSLHASGPSSAQINLDLPIMRIADFTLDGTLQLAGVTAQYDDTSYALNKLTGAVSFDARGPIKGGLSGELFGTPVTLDIGRGRDTKTMRVTLNGRFPVATLSKAVGYDFSRYADGSLPLQATVTVPLVQNGPPVRVSLSSQLGGLALKLPEPVGKTASGKRLFAAHASFVNAGMRATVRYADVLSACLDFALGGTETGFRGADVVLGPGACHAPAPGLYVHGGWPKLELDRWVAQLPRATGTGTGNGMQEAFAIDLRFGEIDGFGQHLRNQTIKGKFGTTQMTLDFEGDMLAGQVLVPRTPTNENPIVATLTRGDFTVPGKPVVITPPASAAAAASASTAGTSSAAAARGRSAANVSTAAAGVPTASNAAAGAGSSSSSHFKPQTIPPFTLHAAHLELGDAGFDDVYIVARRVPNGIAVDPIHVGDGALKLEGTLVWLDPPAGEPLGALHFVGKVHALGRLFTGLGFGPVVTGNGALSAGLAWHILPGENKFANDLLGRVSVDLRDGSISQVSPGAGRLLSLFNLANIPRYLVFNFHNLFGKGFPFSRIHGDYAIDHGVARTKGLDIDSSVASIKITGMVDIARGTMDQKAGIEPNYFGSLPVVAALVGGLGIGAAVYAVTKLFGNPLASLTKLEYSITGPISNPLVKPLGKTPPPQAGTRIVPAAIGATRPVPVPAAANASGG